MTKEPESSDPSDPSDPSGPGSGAPAGAHPRPGELEALFRGNYRKVVYFFLRNGVTEEDAPDLAQEVFLRAHRGWAGYRGDASRSTWIFEIARNLFKNFLRDRAALKRSGPEVPIDAGANPDPDAAPTLEIPDPDPLPIDILLKAERQQILAREIAKMPPQRQQCVKLRVQGLQYKEIAEVMRLSIETVKSHLYQAREALKLALGTSGKG